MGPSGEPIEATPYRRDLRFTHAGRVVTAMDTVNATAPGVYTMTAIGDRGPGVLVSVGRVLDPLLVAGAGGSVVLLVGGLSALVAPALAHRYRSAWPAAGRERTSRGAGQPR